MKEKKTTNESIKENEALVELVKLGDMAAAEELYFQNLPIIRSVCRKIIFDPGEFEDYLQQCFIFMIVDAKNFDDTKGFKFISYLSKCLVGQIRGYKYYKAGTGLYEKNTSSLDKQIGDDGYVSLLNFTSDPEAEFEEDVLDDVNQEELRIAVKEILKELPADLSEIINMRYLKKSSLEECSIQLNVSKERVRQKQIEAEKLLKQPEYINKLRPFVLVDDDYNSYGLRNTGLSSWKNTGYSSVERAAEVIISKKGGLNGRNVKERMQYLKELEQKKLSKEKPTGRGKKPWEVLLENKNKQNKIREDENNAK